MEQLAAIVLQRARTILDKVKIYEIQIQAYVGQNQLLKAVNTALPILDLLGVSFPENPSQSDLQIGLEETRSLLGNKTIKDLSELPEMTDPYKLAAMRILSIIWGSAYMALPVLMPLTVLQMVNLSVTSGNTSISAFGYACYGLILVEVVRDLQAGYEFGQLGVTVLSRFYDREVESKTLEVFNAFVRHWKDHVKETLPPLMQSYQSGLDTGDLEFVAYCGYVYAKAISEKKSTKIRHAPLGSPLGCRRVWVVHPGIFFSPKSLDGPSLPSLLVKQAWGASLFLRDGQATRYWEAQQNRPDRCYR